jgi:hypothetical protein
MPCKPQSDFSIDLSPTTEPFDGERSPPASPVPQPNAKKPYNFSEARRQALERGRQKCAANLKRQREEREAQKAQLKAKKEQALAASPKIVTLLSFAQLLGMVPWNSFVAGAETPGPRRGKAGGERARGKAKRSEKGPLLSFEQERKGPCMLP